MDVAEHQDGRDNILVLVERRDLRTHKSLPDNKSGKEIGETKMSLTDMFLMLMTAIMISVVLLGCQPIDGYQDYYIWEQIGG